MNNTPHHLFRAFALGFCILLLCGCGGHIGPAVYTLNMDSGDGPIELLDAEITDNGGGTSLLEVSFSPGGVNEILTSGDFQLQIFVDDPDHDIVIYYSGVNAKMVTPEFELLDEFVPYADPLLDTVTFTLPFYDPEIEALTVLGWDNDPEHRFNTALPGLPFYGFEIGRVWFQAVPPPQQKKSSEVYTKFSTPEEIEKANNKGWPAKAGDLREDDGTNPPGNPGGLYKGWPLTFAPNIRYWEYSGTIGFIKRVHVDLNGNGEIDPGEPHGYVGRCPYNKGDNVQPMTGTGCTWITTWRNHGQRIVHEFRKVTNEDGTEEWRVKSTHQTQQEDGSWQQTEGTEPIDNPPYQNPNDVPDNSSFGLPG